MNMWDEVFYDVIFLFASHAMVAASGLGWIQ